MVKNQHMVTKKKDANLQDKRLTVKEVSSKTPSSRPPGSGVETVMLRNDFYRDGAKKMQTVLIISVCSFILSIVVLMIAMNQVDKNVYFATDNNGAFIKLVPMSEANHSDASIANWLSEALVDTFDFHFANLEKRVNESALKWFTSNGATELISALEESNNFSAIRERKMFVSLALKHTPIVLNQGLPSWSKYYLWELQVEGIMTYRTTAEEFSNKVMFTVVISRRSMLEDPSGLGIAKIIMKVAK